MIKSRVPATPLLHPSDWLGFGQARETPFLVLFLYGVYKEKIKRVDRSTFSFPLGFACEDRNSKVINSLHVDNDGGTTKESTHGDGGSVHGTRVALGGTAGESTDLRGSSGDLGADRGGI